MELPAYSLAPITHPVLKIPVPGLELLMKPPAFYGAGFKPGELVSIELVIGDIPIVGVDLGEGVVGIAFAEANEYGAFKAVMEPTATIQFILRGDMSAFIEKGLAGVLPTIKDPIPPGVYTVIATGVVSGLVASAPIEFIVPPPPK